jgi:hypothetical protein
LKKIIVLANLSEILQLAFLLHVGLALRGVTASSPHGELPKEAI